MQAFLIECDMMGRTMQFKTPEGQLAAFVAKSTKNLITTQLIGTVLACFFFARYQQA
jgi:hypothetical protein